MLSKCDVALLQVERVRSVDEARAYIDKLATGAVPEADARLFGDADTLASLRDNMDFALLARSDASADRELQEGNAASHASCASLTRC